MKRVTIIYKTFYFQGKQVRAKIINGELFFYTEDIEKIIGGKLNEFLNSTEGKASAARICKKRGCKPEDIIRRTGLDDLSKN